MDLSSSLLSLIEQIPNMAGLVLLAFFLQRNNSRLMDFMERMIANMSDDLHVVRNDVKRIKDKLDIDD